MTRAVPVLALMLTGLLSGPSWPQTGDPGSVPAQGGAAQADPLAALGGAIDAARRQMDTDLSGAAAALDHLAVESMELRRTRTLSDLERPMHRDLFLLRANAHLQLLNNDRVEESFREVLRIDPFFTGQLAPREQELMDALRAREGGGLEVASPERAAKIVLNGVTAGLTGDAPTRLPLLAGEYELRLEKEGFQAGVARVTIAAGQTTTIRDLAPQRRVPPVVLLADRDDVEVAIDNAPPARMARLQVFRNQLTAAEASAIDQAVEVAKLDAATTAGFLLRNPPVDRPIVARFRRECFVETVRTIAVTSEALAKLGPDEAVLWFGDASVVRLQPDTGTLRVVSAPSDADVFVDGQLLGRTPFERGVCSGQHRVRVRHRIGSFNAVANVSRGRTEALDAVLKPSVAVVGAVETVEGRLRALPDLAAQIDRTLASAVTTYRAAGRIDLPPEVPRWTDQSAVELVGAADHEDSAAVMSLLRLANENYDAALILAAVRRPAASGSEGPVDLLVFWSDHPNPDRIRWTTGQDDLKSLLSRLDVPAEASELVYQNHVGVRVADTMLPGAALLVVRVDAGSAAELAGLKPGDVIEALDGTVVTGGQFADRVRQKRPGDLVALRIAAPGAAPRLMNLPVQRRPSRAPVFDPAYYGNALIAKLTVAGILTPSAAERDLYGFNLALAYMRFGDYRRALDLLGGLGTVAEGYGVGKGAVQYFKARCLDAMGEREKALAAYKEVSALGDLPLADDGAGVATLARRRMSALARTP
jgi:hypothetical protein